jgi:hypothetical protein
MTPRERVRSLVLRALQDERITRAIAHPKVTRAAMAAVAVQARIDGLEAALTRAVAHAFNLPTREETLALRRKIQRLEAELATREAETHDP